MHAWCHVPHLGTGLKWPGQGKYLHYKTHLSPRSQRIHLAKQYSVVIRPESFVLDWRNTHLRPRIYGKGITMCILSTIRLIECTHPNHFNRPKHFEPVRAWLLRASLPIYLSNGLHSLSHQSRKNNHTSWSLNISSIYEYLGNRTITYSYLLTS